MKLTLLCLATTVTLAGCGSAESPSGSSVSTVMGALDTPSFPGSPSGIAAVNEGGSSVRSNLGVKGAFKLRLQMGHTYHLDINGSSPAAVPLVFKRASGQLDTTFRVSGGGAVVQLGTVRYVAQAASVAADDQGQVSCGGANDQTDDHGADGECENGVDKTTGAACTDPPDTSDTSDRETADPAEPMAVADHNVPDDLEGCDGEDPAD
jgi:hypothetical protein